MKKFTKVCLLTASILFALSIICFIGVGIHRKELVRNFEGAQTFGFGVGEEIDNLLKGEYDLEDFELLASFDADETDSFSIDMDAGNVIIKEGRTDEVKVWAQQGNNTKSLSADLQRNGTLSIEEQAKKQVNFGFRNWLGWFGKGYSNWEISNVIIEIPDKQWKQLNSTISLGVIKLYDFSAESISMDSEAGSIYTEGTLKADDVYVHADMGSIELDIVECGKLTVDSDMGNAEAKQITADTLEVTLDMGNLEFQKVLAQNTKADCNMGNIELQFVGLEDDYDISYDVDMGDVELNGGGSNRNAQNRAELDCDMGNIEVTFLKNLK